MMRELFEATIERLFADLATPAYVMSCEGGCICGPGVIANPKFAANKLKEYVDSKEVC